MELVLGESSGTNPGDKVEVGVKEHYRQKEF